MRKLRSENPLIFTFQTSLWSQYSLRRDYDVFSLSSEIFYEMGVTEIGYQTVSHLVFFFFDCIYD